MDPYGSIWIHLQRGCYPFVLQKMTQLFPSFSPVGSPWRRPDPGGALGAWARTWRPMFGKMWGTMMMSWDLELFFEWGWNIEIGIFYGFYMDFMDLETVIEWEFMDFKWWMGFHGTCSASRVGNDMLVRFFHRIIRPNSLQIGSWWDFCLENVAVTCTSLIAPDFWSLVDLCWLGVQNFPPSPSSGWRWVPSMDTMHRDRHPLEKWLGAAPMTILSYPFGTLTVCYGKPQFSMGKSSNWLGHGLHIAMLKYQRDPEGILNCSSPWRMFSFLSHKNQKPRTCRKGPSNKLGKLLYQRSMIDSVWCPPFLEILLWTIVRKCQTLLLVIHYIPYPHLFAASPYIATFNDIFIHQLAIYRYSIQ